MGCSSSLRRARIEVRWTHTHRTYFTPHGLQTGCDVTAPLFDDDSFVSVSMFVVVLSRLYRCRVVVVMCRRRRVVLSFVFCDATVRYIL